MPRFLCALTALAAFPALAEQPHQLDASEALFTVMAAANAAGYDAGLGTSPPLRHQVRERIAASNPPVLAEIKAWYAAHPETDKTRDLSRWISLGLSIKGAPDFGWSTRDVEVPPDALALNAVRVLLPRFYTEAHVEELWKQSQTAIDALLAEVQEPIARAVLESNSYLRQNTSGPLGRRFQIYVEFLAAPNQIQTRSYGDNYFVVLTPASQTPLAAVRHAYYRFLIDPLAIKYGMELKEKESLMDIAERAPLLPLRFHSSFDLFATECLIRAIEARVGKNPAAVSSSVKEGYILVPFFDEQLATYETQPESMRLFFPRMVKALNVKREIKRLEGVEFAQEPSASPAAQPSPTTENSTSPVARTIAEADAAYYDRGDIESARALYERALKQNAPASQHARAYYGLAHVALKQKQPEAAGEFFRKTLDSSPDGETEAWSCYYLGKLSMVAQDPEKAAQWYRQVLAIKGASPKALESTRKGLAELDAAAKQ